MKYMLKGNLVLLILIVVVVGVASNLKSIMLLTAREPVLGQENNSDDSYTALVVGVWFEDIQTISDGGAVNVIYGGLSGLTQDGNQFWHQDSPGILNIVEMDDEFGRALTKGDFDGNGFADLAVSAIGQSVNGIDLAGAVNVIYGTNGGLTGVGNQFWHQDSPGIIGIAEPLDRFGTALAAGDFDGDGYDDLAIGVCCEDSGSVVDSGAIHVIYGSINGLSATGNQVWHQGSPGINGAVEEFDRFGAALTTGDFNGDGKDDLAVGVRGEDIGNILDAGAVNVIYGSENGLTVTGNQIWHQNSPGILDSAEEGEQFGRSIATGDFDSDGYDDLVVGVSLEGINSAIAAGAANVLYGSDTGLTGTGSQFWHQDSPGIPDTAQSLDMFGTSLETADFDGNGFTDLAIGVSGEEIGGVTEAGALHILFGSNDGLTELNTQFWHQDSTGIIDDAEPGDYFGFALAACDFNGDGVDDLAAGVYGEDFSGISSPGAVNVLYGTNTGLSAVGNQFWHQDSLGILDDAENNDFFGLSLACMSGGFSRVYLPVVFQP